ncbi:MAG: cell division ATP-binding protein FtsE [Candidatus Gastranaerophilales bacterium]|nr:cell division ATP-binding protein FtsE [Candidatus Gastranaerophilales bacterium]
MIRLTNITKEYGEHRALDDLNLHIKVGEFVFLVGSSGAGKSTLMRLIYREELPTDGEILVGGIDVTKIKYSQVPQLRKCMGMVFQDFKLLTNQSAYDNVAYVIRALGMSTKEIDMRVKGALKVVGLLHKIDAKPSELSGGEQQRIGIARAIVNGPPLLIADEPTGNLDPQTSLEIMEILEQINLRGTTIVVSTHDQAIVDRFKKRVVTLESGKVIRDVYSGTYE